MCRVLEIHPSGFYAWLKQPESKRAIEDKRLLGQIKQFWIESGFSYGYRNITLDMKDHGESCGKNRVHRIMREADIRSQRGYKRHRGFSCRRKKPLLRMLKPMRSRLNPRLEPMQIQLEAKALKDNPQLIDLRIAEKWDGKLPKFSGGEAIPLLNIDNLD